MAENQYLLSQLQQLLSWKKSKKFYAEKLGITEAEVSELLKELKSSPQEEYNDGEESVVKYEEDISKGVGEIIFNSPEEIRSLDELVKKCKIDTNKWEITKYVQNYWGNSKSPHWQVKAWLSLKTEAYKFQDEFVNFLKTYTPSSEKLPKIVKSSSKPYGCLLINKQDAHFDKLGVDGDSNDMEERFAVLAGKLITIVNQAEMSNELETIVYVVGSDEFNSEFTGTTTKGTPQQNIATYHDSFMGICDYEVKIISYLKEHCNDLRIVYVPGNHDEYVGWHLIKWLESYFRDVPEVVFDSSPKYRKYLGFGTTAFMLNHGDAMKPAKLAGIFPIEFKDKWSYYQNFYIFTGDKHHELSQDFGGIKFYQIPAFSSAKSSWDEKNGYTGSKAEMTGFLIDYYEGITNIFKQYL